MPGYVTVLGDFPDGWPAIRVALARMRRLAFEGSITPEIRAWAVEAVRGCPPLDVGCELVRVRRRMARELRYTADPQAVDLVQHPLYTLAVGGGDCDCLATFLAAAGLALGWRVRYVVGSRSKPVPTHVLPEVLIGARWVPVEVSSRSMPVGLYPPGFVGQGVVTL